MCSICFEYVVGETTVKTSDGHMACSHCIHLHYCYSCLKPTEKKVLVDDNMFCQHCAEIEIEYIANFTS